ncbi:hypothetical protein GCK72_003909 [Caenorhabditis remanei]|uniref:mitogen-activated protein kinase kinase n=1 Tax=Caenorhabditis remanei TaxID=31234 RepID=A0A6A5HC45_CAERE|nr:hypothetical protein GCK72_003909 [Caenorhabditis remanei]KAF1763963.1 hypothetical protein GCK72_003909 [Caenorhabditis remanei]
MASSRSSSTTSIGSRHSKTSNKDGKFSLPDKPGRPQERREEILETSPAKRLKKEVETVNECAGTSNLVDKNVNLKVYGTIPFVKNTYEQLKEDNGLLTLPTSSVTVTPKDFTHIQYKGEGVSGRVEIVEYKKFKVAMKSILIGTTPKTTKIDDVVRELNFLKMCKGCDEFIFFRGFLERANYVDIFMEPMRSSLACFIKKEIKLPEIALRAVIAHITIGLHWLLDALGSIHRDIKPGNLLCDDNGHVKIGDLGSCARVEDIEIDEKKQSVAGTISYQPPEAVSKTMTEASLLKLDTWSLGISILELATSKHPFSQQKLANQEDTLEFDIIVKNPPALPTNSIKS